MKLSRCRNRGLWSGFLLAAVLGLGLTEAQAVGAERPLLIGPGDNLLQTTSPTTLQIGVLPVGFFGSTNGSPSNAIDLSGTLMRGRPTGPLGHLSDSFKLGVATHNGGDTNHATIDVRDGGGAAATDATFRRVDGATLNNIGSSATIQFRIASLSLENVNGITVTYPGQPSSVFDVFLELDPATSTQPMGSAMLTRTSDGGGTFASSLPVTSRLTFTNRVPAGPAAIAAPVRTDNLSGTGSFQVILAVPTMSAWGMAVMVVLLLIAGVALLRRRRTVIAA